MENHIDIPNSATTDSAIINNNNNNNYNNNNDNNSNNNNDNNNYFYDEKLTPTSADDPESMTSGIDSTNSFANIEKSKCTPLDGIIGKKKKFYHLIKINLWLLPLLGAIMIPISCISLYYGAIKHEIVYPLFPYVSDTGSMTPMAPYFSLFLDLSGIIIIIVGWARYKTIKFYLNHIQPNDSTKKNMQTFEFYMKRLYKCNLTLLILCFLGAFGSMVIGNFRTTENMTGHLIGAFFLFFSLLIFMLISCYVTWKLYSYAGIESKPISMILILLVYSISLFIVCLCAFISIIHHGSIFKYWDNEFRLNWSPKDDGYHWHCTATINEWIAINSMALFFLTISRRLRKFEHWDKVFF